MLSALTERKWSRDDPISNSNREQDVGQLSKWQL